ncbi:YqjD family protein [uncultured Ramlibacter sp.]|uniref:DUF883 family protein n=1 Tax=uncultured Ramlibacter sp. TaxID=260755 RepID=UPI002621E4BA|nr:DUF883 family protein [uncultured Ramlibacter sp.]
MDDSTAQSKDKLMADLREVIADFEDLFKQVAGQAGDKATEATLRMQARFEQAKADLAGLEELAGEQARKAGQAADGYVRENPWTAVGIGAGVGLLVGLLLARR